MDTFTLAEVSQHKRADDLWLVVHNKVYNVTKYLEEHPGGAEILKEVAGKDATEEFEEVGHSEEANEHLEGLCIGHLPEEEHAEAVEVYKPKYEQVAQAADIIVKKTAGARNAKSFGQIVTKLGLAGTVGAVAWASYRLYTGNSTGDWRALQKLWAQISRGLITGSSSSSSSSSSLSLSSSRSEQFWWGIGIASVLEASATVALGAWAWSKFDVQEEFTHYKPRRVARVDRALGPKKLYTSTSTAPSSAARTSRVLDPKTYRPFKLVRKTLVSPNVYRFIFALSHPDASLGLPTGQHIALQANINGQTVSRSYTPISNNSDLGRIELLIKVYEGGAMTKHLEGMKVGDSIDIRGPKGAMQYSPTYAKHIGMIAGGTGITPMYQLIRAICDDESDNDTKISLLYANNTEEDILLREELDGYVLQCPEKFSVHYVLAKPSEGWTGESGFVSPDMIKKYLPGAADDTKMLLCGPPPMISAMKKTLVGQGFAEPRSISKAADQVFLF